MNYYTVKANEYLQNGDDLTFNKVLVNKRVLLHNHDFIEIAYVSSGTGTQVINGDIIRIGRGDLFLINRETFHEYTADEENPMVIYNCIFQPLFIYSYFENCGDFVDLAYRYLSHTFKNDCNPENYIKITGIKSKNLEPVFEEMYCEYEMKEDGYIQMIKSALSKLLILMFRAYRSENSQKQSSPVYNEFIIGEAIEYLKKNYKNNINCTALAKRLYLSTNYFHRIFKKITGVSVIQMLQDIRIKEACSLLSQRMYSIEEAAFEVGYSDVKYFYQIFKKKLNMTPGEYRKLSKDRIPPQ